jgi:hypothetical protein
MHKRQHTKPANSGIHHHDGKPAAAALAPTVVSTATDVAVPDVPVAVALIRLIFEVAAAVVGVVAFGVAVSDGGTGHAPPDTMLGGVVHASEAS